MENILTSPAIGTRSASEFFEQTRRAKIAWQRRHGKNARRLLRKATQRNKPQFYTKLASERIVSYSTIHPVYRYTGSSFNRKLKERDNETDQLQRAETATALLLPFNDELSGRIGSPVNGIHSNEAGESSSPRRLERSKNRKIDRVHVLSTRSKQKIRAKIQEFFSWCRRNKKQCTFLTLTFIDDLSDRLAIRILNKFLTSIRQEVGDGFQYIRVAERQKNGRIHFHLILDRPINIIRFNSLWVVAQYNAGLLGMSRQLDLFVSKEEVISRHEKLMTLYQEYKVARERRDYKSQKRITEKLKEVSIGKFFNPVDIKKISSPAALSGYLTKYVTKNDASFGCLAWSCSRGVSQMFTASVVPFSVWEESKNQEINSYVSADGELITPVPYQDQKGLSVSIRIFNRKYFDQYLAEMRVVNDWILSGAIDFPDVPRYQESEYHKRVFTYGKNLDPFDLTFTEFMENVYQEEPEPVPEGEEFLQYYDQQYKNLN
jgi:hypothetical protein